MSYVKTRYGDVVCHIVDAEEYYDACDVLYKNGVDMSFINGGWFKDRLLGFVFRQDLRENLDDLNDELSSGYLDKAEYRSLRDLYNKIAEELGEPIICDTEPDYTRDEVPASEYDIRAAEADYEARIKRGR